MPLKTSVDMCLDKSINFAFPLTLKFHFPKDRESTLLSSNPSDIPVSYRQYKEHAWQWNIEIDVKWSFQKHFQRLPVSIFFLKTWVILNFFFLVWLYPVLSWTQLEWGFLEYFSYPLVAGLEIFEVLPQLNHSPRQSAKHHLQSLHLKQQHIQNTIFLLKSALKFMHYSWFQRTGPLSVRKCSGYIYNINLAKPLTWKKMNVKIPVLNYTLNQDSWLQRISLSTHFIIE